MLHSALSWNSQYDTSLFTIPWRLEGKVQAECQNYFIYFYLSVKCKNIYIFKLGISKICTVPFKNLQRTVHIFEALHKFIFLHSIVVENKRKTYRRDLSTYRTELLYQHTEATYGTQNQYLERE